MITSPPPGSWHIVSTDNSWRKDANYWNLFLLLHVSSLNLCNDKFLIKMLDLHKLSISDHKVGYLSQNPGVARSILFVFDEARLSHCNVWSALFCVSQPSSVQFELALAFWPEDRKHPHLTSLLSTPGLLLLQIEITYSLAFYIYQIKCHLKNLIINPNLLQYWHFLLLIQLISSSSSLLPLEFPWEILPPRSIFYPRCSRIL